MTPGTPEHRWLLLVVGVVLLSATPVVGASTHHGVDGNADAPGTVSPTGAEATLSALVAVPGQDADRETATPFDPGLPAPVVRDRPGGDHLAGDIGTDPAWVATAPGVPGIRPTGDFDGDGIANRREVRLGTDLTAVDSDRDGLVDPAEVGRYDTDPTARDTDGDGLPDAREVAGPTSPLTADTDGDGLSDRRETKLATDPVRADTDGDGLGDGAELAEGTDPTARDTDGDGLGDGREVTDADRDPLVADGNAEAAGSPVERAVRAGVALLLEVSLAGVAVGSVVGAALVTVFAAAIGPVPVPGRAGADAGSDVESSSNPGDPDDLSVTPEQGPPDEELMPDEQFVERILRSNGGRLKQTAIVDATGWSKSKVSRLLSRMCEEGGIVKVRLGRENLICLDGREPDIVQSNPAG